MTRKFIRDRGIAIAITIIMLSVNVLLLYTIPDVGKGNPPFSGNQPVNTNIGTTDRFAPSIAVDNTGKIYVAWEDHKNGHGDIFFANSTDLGKTWSDPNVKINDDVTSEDQTTPSLGIDSNGVLHVVWADVRAGSGDADIFSSNSTDKGATWSTNKKINTDGNTLMPQSDPDLCVGLDGTVYVAWQDFRAMTDFDIYFSKSTDKGATWLTSDVKVNIDATNANQFTPTIAVNDADVLFAAWGDERLGDSDIFFSKSIDGGSSWSPNVRVNSDDPGNTSSNPAITVDNSGNIYIAWQDNRNGTYDIYFSKSSDGGSSWSPEIRVDDAAGASNQRAPDIAVNSTGDIFVVWEDFRSTTNFDVYFAKSSNEGANWTQPNIRVNDDVTILDQEKPNLVVSPNGTSYVVWQDERTGANTYDIFFSYLMPPALPPEIDRVLVSRSPDGSTGWASDKSYFISESDTFYACGWNNTIGFVELVDATWGSSDPPVGGVTSPGTSTSFTAQSEGTCIITATTAHGTNDTGILTVNPLNIDSIVISRSSTGGSGWIGDRPYEKYDTDTFYACGWNTSFNEFVELIDAIWVSDNTSVGTVSIGPANSTTFNAVDVGICIVNATNSTHGVNFTGILSIVQGIDRFFISLSSDGSTDWIGDHTYVKHDVDTLYACGWNDTDNELVSLLDVDWESDDSGIGTVGLETGSSTTFTAVGVGQCKVSAYQSSLGMNWTGILTVDPLDIDKIMISLSLNGSSGWIGDQVYGIAGSEIFYACGWNNAHDEFVALVDVDWASDDTGVGMVDLGPSNATTFSAVAPGTCTVTATHGTYGTNSTGILTVIDLGLNSVLISLEPNGAGGWIGDQIFDFGESDIFYACGWNDTFNEFVTLLDVEWQSDNTAIATVVLGPANSTNFEITGFGTCRVSATNATYGVNWTGTLTVLEPEIDEIIIRTGGNEGGKVLGDATYIVHQREFLYAAAYNDTYGYVKDVQGIWESSDESVGQVSTIILTTTFYAQFVDEDNSCTITVTYENISNTTGSLFVLAPRVDEIKIRDTQGGLGNITTTGQYSFGETDIFYAAAYNKTGLYLYDVEATWTVDDTNVGHVTSPGICTNFTALQVDLDDTCSVTATYLPNIFNSTGLLTVLTSPDITAPAAPSKPTLEVKGSDKIEISWEPNDEADLAGYNIYRRTSPDDDWMLVGSVNAQTTTYTDTDLKAGTTYYYSITAIDDASTPNESPYSTETFAKTDSEDGFPWLIILILIIVIIVILVLVMLLARKKPTKEGEIPGEGAPSESQETGEDLEGMEDEEGLPAEPEDTTIPPPPPP